MRLIRAASAVFTLALVYAISGYAPATHADQPDGTPRRDGEHALKHGQAIFRFDTFGDEQLWTDVLRMHEVDRDGRPGDGAGGGPQGRRRGLAAAVVAALRAGEVDLTNPAVTIELLRLNAVVGVQGHGQRARVSSPASASPARCAIRRSTTHLRRASAGGWTDGRTST